MNRRSDEGNITVSFFQGMVLSIALGHLLLVSLGAVYKDFPGNNPVSAGIQWYSKASGADSSYGFFAPRVGSKVRTIFDSIDAGGVKTTNLRLEKDSGREAAIRLGGFYDEFTSKEAEEDPEFRQQLGATLAAAIFTEHPEAVQAVLHLEEYDPVSMEAYRQGERSSWEEIYQATFARIEEKPSP